MRNIALLSGALALTVIPTSTSMAQPTQLDITVNPISDDRVCGASYQLGGNKKLEFLINAENFNVSIMVQNLPAEIVEKGLEKKNVPITVIVNDSYRTTADTGVYRAGFTYRAMAYWDDNDQGIQMLGQLADVKTLSVEFDGQKYGPANSKPSADFGYELIVNCLRNKGVDI
ncbi:MAG: hypothetical protein AAGH53_06415 [Pseudomonadota bacterium]